MANLSSIIKEKRTLISKGEQRTPSYAQINPLKKVPALREEPDGFTLNESSAIMRYLCLTRTATVPLHFYPYNDVHAMAKIDAVMSWHASTLRIGSMITVWNLVIARNLNLPSNSRLVDDYGLPMLRAAFDALESGWLPANTKTNTSTTFLAGMPEISIADLLVACEIEQVVLVNNGALLKELLTSHPGVKEWLARVRRACAPHYNQVHEILFKMQQRMPPSAARSGGGRGERNAGNASSPTSSSLSPLGKL